MTNGLQATWGDAWEAAYALEQELLQHRPGIKWDATTRRVIEKHLGEFWKKALASPSAPSGWQPDIDRAVTRLTALRDTLRSTPLPGIEATLDGVIDDLTCAPQSGAADPIAAAVHAQLDPLKDALIAMGHKLAKGGESHEGLHPPSGESSRRDSSGGVTHPPSNTSEVSR